MKKIIVLFTAIFVFAVNPLKAQECTIDLSSFQGDTALLIGWQQNVNPSTERIDVVDYVLISENQYILTIVADNTYQVPATVKKKSKKTEPTCGISADYSYPVL